MILKCFQHGCKRCTKTKRRKFKKTFKNNWKINDFGSPRELLETRITWLRPMVVWLQACQSHNDADTCMKIVCWSRMRWTELPGKANEGSRGGGPPMEIWGPRPVGGSGQNQARAPKTLTTPKQQKTTSRWPKDCARETKDGSNMTPKCFQDGCKNVY